MPVKSLKKSKVKEVRHNATPKSGKWFKVNGKKVTEKAIIDFK